MMKKILVAYETKTGYTRKMAEKIAEGVRLGGDEPELRVASEFKKPEDLLLYDGIILGSPTYYRHMLAEMQDFLFMIRKADLAGKMGGAFGSFLYSGEGPQMIFETMELVLNMDMMNTGALKLKESVVNTDEGILACQNYGRAMSERSGKITMKGNPLTLEGRELAVGDEAPDVTLFNNDLEPVSLSSYRGKICILSTVPSLDTPVCDMETRRFNEEAGSLGDNVAIVTISMDLPFAQKRWCGAAGVDKVVTLSDYHDRSFGNAYGVLIKELKLLARAVFVLDAKGIIQYVQLVNEVTDEPDYQEVLEAAKKLG